MNLRILVRQRRDRRLLDHLLQLPMTCLRIVRHAVAVEVDGLAGLQHRIACCACCLRLRERDRVQRLALLQLLDGAVRLLLGRLHLGHEARHVGGVEVLQRGALVDQLVLSMNSIRDCLPARVRGRPEPASAWNEKPPSRSAFMNLLHLHRAVRALDLQERGSV
jgi:hypothetical protein